MSFFYPDQAYPGNDPFEVARQMGLNPYQAMQMMQGGSGQMGGPMGGGPDFDPNMLAEMVGQQYNPYQGYPTKQVSDQIWDVYGPMAEYLLPQMYNIQNPDAEGFDLDAFFGADPALRGPLAEAYTQAEGDPIDIYSYLQSNEPQIRERVNEKGETVSEEVPGFQDRLRKEVGRTEWADLAEQGHLPIIRAINEGASGEELDDIALDYYMKGLEDVLAAGAPTSQRALSQLDYTRQREGFRPAPGTGQELPGYEGPGFGGGGGDPLSALAGSPQYGGGGGEQQVVGGRSFQFVRDDPEAGGFWVRPGGGGGDFSAPGKRAAQKLRSGSYRRQQDANGGGRSSGGRRSSGGSRGGFSDLVRGYTSRASRFNPVNWF